MPLVQVKLIEGVFSDVQKQEMIRKLTDAMVSIEGEAMRAVTWVIVTAFLAVMDTSRVVVALTLVCGNMVAAACTGGADGGATP